MVSRRGFIKAVAAATTIATANGCGVHELQTKKDEKLLSLLMRTRRFKHVRYYEGRDTSGWVISSNPNRIDLLIYADDKLIDKPVDQFVVKAGSTIVVIPV